MRRLALCIAVILAANAAQASEFYADFSVNRKRVGSFVVYEKSESLMIEGAAIRALKLPCVEDMPLETLAKYGEYRWDQENQVINLKTNKLGILNASANEALPKLDVEPLKIPNFGVKALDYQLYSMIGSSGSDQQATFTGTARAFGLDLDLSLYTQERAGGTANWHNEANNYVRDVKVGSIPTSGIDRGVAVTNETSDRYQSGFGVEQIQTDYPIGTKIDIYQNISQYIGSVTTDKPQYVVSLPLSYGSSSYLLRAFLPTGQMIEREVIRNIDSYMTKTGQFSYNVAAGVDRTNVESHLARISYGLNNKLTLFADTDKSQTGAGVNVSIPTGRADTDWVVKGHGGTTGYNLSSFVNDKFLGAFSLNYSRANNIKAMTAIVAPKLAFSPALTIVNTIMVGSTTTAAVLRGSTSFKGVSLTPRLEFTETKTVSNVTDSRGIGAVAIASLPMGFVLRADALWTKTAFNSSGSYELDIDRRFESFGSMSLKNKFTSQQTRFEAGSSELDLQIQGWKYATLMTTFTHGWQDHSNVATVSLTGSLTTAGVASSPQAQMASIQIRTYIDNSGKGRFIAGIDELIKADLTINGREVENTGEYVMHSLMPYSVYDISVGSKVDCEPVEANYKVTTVRGEVAVVDVPYKRVFTFDGRTDNQKGNELVELLLKDGTYKQIYSGDGGYWSTRIREDLAPAVFEVRKIATPVKTVPAPEIAVAKPVVTAKTQANQAKNKVNPEPEPVPVVTASMPIIAPVVASASAKPVVKTAKKNKYYIVAAYASSEIKAQVMAVKVKDWLNAEGKAVKIKTFITTGKEHVDIIKPQDCLAFLEDCYKLVASKSF